MHMTQGWTGLRTAVVALGLLVAAAPGVKADSLLGYTTTGGIDTMSGSGAGVISYVPVSTAQIDLNSNLPLGSFQVSSLPSGASMSYDNTPFSITLTPNTYGGSSTGLEGATPVTFTGVINGTVTDTASSLTAIFNPVSASGFTFLGASSTVSVLKGAEALLVPSSAGGTTTLEAQLVTTGTPSGTPAPEPSTVALFLSTFGGLGLRRYVLRRRARAAA
jgi:hypothetical protein